MDLKGFALGLLLLLAMMPAWAAAPVVRVAGPDPVAAQVAELLAKRVAGIEVRRDDAPARLVVAVGARAFRDALDAQSAVRAADKPGVVVPVVVGVALTRHAWRQVVDTQAGPRPGQTALFWDPDPVRQLRLARAVLPGARSVGVVLGAPDELLVTALRREAKRLGLDVVVGTLGADDSLPRRLNAVLADSDFLLGIDDPLVFSPELAKTVLLTSYRHGKPVIGPNAAYVGAGSVASLVATLPDMVDTLAASLPALLAGDVPPPRYPDHYTVATNPQVARSLLLSLPSVQRLEALLRVEGGTP